MSLKRKKILWNNIELSIPLLFSAGRRRRLLFRVLRDAREEECNYSYYYFVCLFVCLLFCINVFFLQCLPLICLWLCVVFVHNVITCIYTVLCLWLALWLLTRHINNKASNYYYYYGSTALCWVLAAISVSWSYTQSVGLHGRGISPSQGLYLYINTE
jgi:hypothetical protein